MNCDWVQQNIALYLYGELADDARYETEQHIARCHACATELAEQQEFQAQMNALPVEEPSANFLAASRMRLQEALESAEQGGWWSRLIFDPVHWLNQIRFAPALAAAIFIVGFAGGIGATYKMVKIPIDGPLITPAPASVASISGISSIIQQPGSKQVTIKYETVSPQEAHGSLGDPNIQQQALVPAIFGHESNTAADVRPRRGAGDGPAGDLDRTGVQRL